MTNTIKYTSVRAEQSRAEQSRAEQSRAEQPHALVSVIVPVYNVEKYLSRCLDSILAQTYTNLEILIIDDGSTDNSGKICDEYSQRDHRFRVIHQENHGVGQVRNIGLRESKGEYIQFVDSDDWIEPETIASCYRFLQEYDADIVCFKVVHEYEDGRQRSHDAGYVTPTLLNKYDAFSAALLPGVIAVYPVNKFIKKKLFSGIQYPEWEISEDIETTYKFIANAEKVLTVNNKFYHYLRHEGSVSRRPFFQQTDNIIKAINNYTDFAARNNMIQNSTQKDNAMCGLWFWKICYANMMLMYDRIDNEFIRSLQRDIKPSVVLRCSLLSFARKVQFILFKLNTGLYKAVYMKFKR